MTRTEKYRELRRKIKLESIELGRQLEDKEVKLADVDILKEISRLPKNRNK